MFRYLTTLDLQLLNKKYSQKNTPFKINYYRITTDILICYSLVRINRTIHRLGCYPSWVGVEGSDSEGANLCNLEFAKLYLKNYFKNIRQLIRYFLLCRKILFVCFLCYIWIPVLSFRLSVFTGTMEIKVSWKKRRQQSA